MSYLFINMMGVNTFSVIKALFYSSCDVVVWRCSFFEFWFSCLKTLICSTFVPLVQCSLFPFSNSLCTHLLCLRWSSFSKFPTFYFSWLWLTNFPQLWHTCFCFDRWLREFEDFWLTIQSFIQLEKDRSFQLFLL